MSLISGVKRSWDTISAEPCPAQVNVDSSFIDRAKDLLINSFILRFPFRVFYKGDFKWVSTSEIILDPPFLCRSLYSSMIPQPKKGLKFTFEFESELIDLILNENRELINTAAFSLALPKHIFNLLVVEFSLIREIRNLEILNVEFPRTLTCRTLLYPSLNTPISELVPSYIIDCAVNREKFSFAIDHEGTSIRNLNGGIAKEINLFTKLEHIHFCRHELQKILKLAFLFIPDENEFELINIESEFKNGIRGFSISFRYKGSVYPFFVSDNLKTFEHCLQYVPLANSIKEKIAYRNQIPLNEFMICTSRISSWYSPNLRQTCMNGYFISFKDLNSDVIKACKVDWNGNNYKPINLDKF